MSAQAPVRQPYSLREVIEMLEGLREAHGEETLTNLAQVYRSSPGGGAGPFIIVFQPDP